MPSLGLSFRLHLDLYRTVGILAREIISVSELKERGVTL